MNQTLLHELMLFSTLSEPYIPKVPDTNVFSTQNNQILWFNDKFPKFCDTEYLIKYINGNFFVFFCKINIFFNYIFRKRQ